MTLALAVVMPDGYEVFPVPATATGVLAQQPAPPEDPGGQGEEFGKSSPLGLVILILFFLAVGLLWRSMNKHLRRLPASFDPPGETNDGNGEPRTQDPGTRGDAH